ncbi:hypothetical protein DPMN_051488 [Dreissena polymorpha]|uniref:Uncharacterized protein n=1 Tax=Dreissena polymorpha TaxID=45954 RepID=A0A9D4CJ81_DREPO|nr:hypothetical protein DPMN_051488 [Dreissena polymorpha]
MKEIQKDKVRRDRELGMTLKNSRERAGYLIIKTALPTSGHFNEDRTKALYPGVKTRRKTAPSHIISTHVLIKFHEDWAKIFDNKCGIYSVHKPNIDDGRRTKEDHKIAP